jgi:hypothetical protein
MNCIVVQAQWDQRARVECGSIKQSWAVLTAGATVRPADEEVKKMRRNGGNITTAL